MKIQKFFYSLLLVSAFSCFACFAAQAQKLEYWTLFQDMLVEEHLVGRNPDYATITVSIRYRGLAGRTFRVIRQKPIKSPSPQDCMVLSVAKQDTLMVSRGESQDLMTYKIKRGLDLKYLRPMYEPSQYWKVEEVK